MTESLLLSLCSFALSLPPALLGMRALATAFRQTAPALPTVHLDEGVMLFTFAVAAGIGVVMGLIPVLAALARKCSNRASRPGADLFEFEIEHAGAQRHRCRAACDIVMLLAATGLLTESLLQMRP